MVGELSTNEVEMINGFAYLHPGAQREAKDYLQFLLQKQYRQEVKAAVFHNKLLHNLFQSLLHLVEKEDFDLEMVKRRIKQLKELYYNLFEQVHGRYSELVTELDSNETVREFGRIAFENVQLAINSGNLTLIRLEIVDFYQSYCMLGKKKDTRQIMAV